MLKKYNIVILFFLLVTYTSEVIAQVPCPNPGPGPCNPPGVPIDGGVGFLLVIGLGYAVSKLRNKK
ncbi:MAG TPA: hypothetical protein ENK46_13485 [Flavobacteriia bacterium]|jgi:hypothetical protein|nr:hypothetical protein [Flavobacteriia bacterium]